MQSCPIKNQHPKSLYTYRDICIYIVLPLYPKIKKTHMNSPFLVPWNITSPSCCWWNPPWNANKSILILILVKKYQTLAMKQEHHHYHHDIIVCWSNMTYIYIYTWKTPKNHHTISNFMSNISNISYIIIFQKEAKHFHIYISYIYTYTYTYTYSQDIPKHLSIIFLKCSSGHWLVISVYFYGIIHSINGVISVPKTGKGPWLHV